MEHGKSNSIASNSEKLDHLAEQVKSHLQTLHNGNQSLWNENLRLRRKVDSCIYEEMTKWTGLIRVLVFIYEVRYGLGYSSFSIPEMIILKGVFRLDFLIFIVEMIVMEDTMN